MPKVPTPSTVAAASALAAASSVTNGEDDDKSPRSQPRTAARSATTDTVGTSDDDATSVDENTNKSLLNGTSGSSVVGAIPGGEQLQSTILYLAFWTILGLLADVLYMQIVVE